MVVSEVAWEPRVEDLLEVGAGPGEAVVVCNPDGSMAGIGLREAPNLLRPKVVFDAAG